MSEQRRLIRHGIRPLAIALILCLILYLVGIKEWYALTLFPLCSFIIFTHLFDLYRRVRARGHIRKENPLKALFGLLWTNRPHYGGMIVHLGIALLAIGIIGSSLYQSEAKASLLPGDSMAIEHYTLTYEGMSEKVNETSTKIVFTARLSVHNRQTPAGVLEPKKYIQLSSGKVASGVAIRSMPYWWFPQEDLYVILAGQTEDGTASFEVFVNPLVSLIWVGGGILALGGIFAFWPSGAKESSSSEDRRQREEAEDRMKTEAVTDPPSDLPFTSRSDATSEEDGTDEASRPT